MNLTDEQKIIVNHVNGNAVVVAGAGSGKTKCLIERTAKLIEDGIKPESILVFTFTKKAANEIRKRLTERLGEEKAEAITACTIHSLAIKIIRENHEVLGYSQRPTIWTEDKVSRIGVNVYREQVNEDEELQSIVKKIKDIEKSIDDEINGKQEPSLFEPETMEEKEISLSENLHRMRMRVSAAIGDSFELMDSKKDDYEPPTSSLPKTAKMEREALKLTSKQQQMYLSLNHDSPDQILKTISAYRKDFVYQLKNNMRPIPTEISGIEIGEHRKTLEEKYKNEGDFTFAIDMAMKVLNLKQSCSAIEFDDMIMGACRVLNLDSENEYTKKFEHVMVDEYQDVNDQNVEFITLLSQNSSSLMAVGDDDQAIYAFRGGNTQHIMDFPIIFNASIFYLTRNFRCSETIVKKANKLLTYNEVRFNKTMTAHKTEKPGDAEHVLKCIRPKNLWSYDENAHYDKDFKYSIFEEILHDIKSEVGFMDTPPSQIAILARTNYLLTQFNIWSKKYQRNTPIKDRIKFQNLSDVSVFNNKIVDIIHNWFNYLYNPKDFICLRDALMATVKGFGDTAALHLMDAAQENTEGNLQDWFSYIFNQKRHGRTTSLGKKLVTVLEMYKDIMKNFEHKHVYEVFTTIIQHIGLDEKIWSQYIEDIEQMKYDGSEYSTQDKKEEDSVKEATKKFNQKLILYEYDCAIQLLTGLKEEDDMYPKPSEEPNPWDDPFYVPPEEDENTQEEKAEIEKDKFFGPIGLSNWMDEVRTQTEIDQEKDGVILGTMHSSKGKEWKVVFLIGLQDGIMPSSLNHKNKEEERRLMYVGMTRAEDRLMLCWDKEKDVSPFVSEVYEESEIDLEIPDNFKNKDKDQDHYQTYVTKI